MTKYYLTAAGSDSNDGLTKETAFGTYSYAKSKMVPGDILYVYDGILVQPQPDAYNIIIVPPETTTPPPITPPITPPAKFCYASLTGMHEPDGTILRGQKTGNQQTTAQHCKHCRSFYL